MIKQKLTLLMAVIVGATAVNAEIPITTLNKDVIPPSPSSAVYKEYMGSRPSLSTGAMNIPIELYSLSCKNLSIPFSIVYHTNGIKVGDDPYPCGFGWIFNPGMRITRTIMGRPDELFKWEIPTDAEIKNFEKQKSFVREDQYYSYRQSSRDGEPDIFTVNLPDESCTFILDQRNGGFVPVTLGTNLKIDVDVTLYEKINKIIVTDGQGVIYEFGNYTECMDRHPDYITSWMLKQVTLPDGNTVDFEWEGYWHNGYSWNEYDSYSLRDGIQYTDLLHNNVEYPQYIKSTETGNYSYYGKHTVLQHLKSVDFPGGTIELSYKDMYYPWLENICVKNDEGYVVKEVDFSYSKTDNICGPLLKELKISDEGTYRFDYKEVAFNYQSRNARDFWGFYNGKTENPSLVPKIKFLKHYGGTEYEEELLGDADRSVVPSCMDANMLKRITYPTGGYTEYYYEPHRFEGKHVVTNIVRNNASLDEGGGLRVVKVKSVNKEKTDSVTWTYSYGKNGDGLAISVDEPTLDTFVQIYQGLEIVHKYDDLGHHIGLDFLDHRQVWFHAYSDYMKYNVNSTQIWYEEVTEYSDDGKITFQFENPLNKDELATHNYGQNSIICLNSVWSDGPLIKSETVYSLVDGKYEKIKETSYKYGQLVLPIMQGLLVGRHIYNQMPSPEYPDFTYTDNGIMMIEGFTGLSPYYDENAIYYYTKYLIQPRKMRLAETTVRYFGNEEESEEMTSLSFCGNRSLVKSKTVENKGERTVKEEFYYPFEPEYAEPQQRDVLSKMSAANIISSPFKSIVTENGKSTTTVKHFQNYGESLYLPDKETITRESETSIIEYDYDKFGNVCSVTFNGDAKETYLWGYGGLYPVVYAQGVDFNELKVAVGQQYADFSQLSNSYTIERNASDIRAKLKGKSAVSSYTYYPLVGMRTATSPDGKTTAYHYDKKWRLVKIEDDAGRVRSQYAYHVADEQLDVSISVPENIRVDMESHIYASVNGGSGDFVYKWEITNKSGSIYELSGVESGIDIVFDEMGTYTVKVTVEDALTGISSFSAHDIIVAPVCIEMVTEMMNEAAGTARIKVECPNPVKLNFYLYSQLTNDRYEPGGNGTISLSGNGKYEQYSFEETATKDVFFEVNQPCTVYIDMTIESDSHGILHILLKGVEGDNNETFVNDSIQLEKP